MAEYEALINGMQLALEIEVNDLNVLNDSQLVVNHIRGIYEVQDEIMKWYLTRIQKLQTKFKAKNISLQVDLIPREQNEDREAVK